MASSSTVSSVPQHQVFLNFRGEELRNNFVSHLEKALRDNHIKIFFDENAEKGKPLESFFFEEIEKSKIALAIFSKRYTESKWCLDELVKIKERMDENKIVTIPIFYKVEPGEFGAAITQKNSNVDADRKNKWKEALKSVSNRTGFTFAGTSNETQLIDKIVKEVLKKLSTIPADESTYGSVGLSRNPQVPFEGAEGENMGLTQRLSELDEKVDIKGGETSIVGVVGMHGIGKTTLVKAFYKSQKHHFSRRVLLQDISNIVRFDASGKCNLPGMVLKKLLKGHNIGEERYELYKKELLGTKVFIVLDGANNKEHIQILVKGHRDWTKKGSKIVIATSDKSLLEDLEADIYVVPQLNHRDGLNHFHRHAFLHPTHKNHVNEGLMKLSKEFVRYARGNPLALELLGQEVRGKDMPLWEEKCKTLAWNPIPSIRDHILTVTYNELTSEEQKEAFQDIACFRSHDLVYVKSLLDSDIIEALRDKFLINTSDRSRVEMHDLMYTFAREKGSKANIIDVLPKRGGDSNVELKGIFLDVSVIKTPKTISKEHFNRMKSLRYLKFYSSHCPQECEPDHKISIPDELDFPLEEVRCFHWLKYPLEELPPDFNPKNLVDLKLPYSNIERLWKDKKDAPKLKWVDLKHSNKLTTLSGLSNAHNLQRLNLEGCTALKTLDLHMENMKSLVFLNLKGCTALEAFSDIELVSLKKLVLSNCSKLESFLVISKTLEALYLDGTAITELPTTMVNLTTLIKLNLKGCKNLVKLFEGFHKLKDLQELVCSGCSKLSSLPDTIKEMNCLQILLLDGTAITKIPHISSLERLCLSGNNSISLLGDMTQLSQLKWLDLKYCKKLLSIPELPPNLLCLDAHGCESLKTVADPLATHLPMEQIHSTFIFTNCDKLDRAAKEEITTYAQRKCQLLSDALKRCNEGFVPEALFSTCFPGYEVPSWFCHEAVGTELTLKLLPHWNENTFVGIALCAVVSFPNPQEQINSFSVTCKIKLESKDRQEISFDRLVGQWNKDGNKEDKMKSDHVFICYTRCSNNIKCLENRHSGTCTSSTATLKFGVTDKGDRLEVIKCGLRLVYA